MPKKIGVDFTEDSKLNKLDLANEAEIQSTLMAHYSKELATAKHKKDRAEQALKLRKAEIELGIRRNPPADLKVTEAVIEALVTTHGDVVELTNDLMDCKEEVYVFEAATDGIKSRGDMIKVEQQLWQAGYYAAV